MILWNLFWGNSVCQHSSVKIIVLRRQANHNAVPTNTNRKTNQTSVFQRPANSLLTEYLVQHRIRHHIDKQLRLQKWHIMSQNSMISEQIVCVANTPCLLLSGRSLVRIQFGVPKSRSFLFYGLRLFAMQKAKMGGPFGAAHFCIFSFLFSCQ